MRLSKLVFEGNSFVPQKDADISAGPGDCIDHRERCPTRPASLSFRSCRRSWSSGERRSYVDWGINLGCGSGIADQRQTAYVHITRLTDRKRTRLNSRQLVI